MVAHKTVEGESQRWSVWEVLGIVTVALPFVALGGVMITGAGGGEALVSIGMAYVPGAVWVIDTLARKFVKKFIIST